MPIPNPEPGLVISYAYLWHREHEAGREEGRKDRPSVIVLAIEREADDATIVTVLPITHSPPADQNSAVEIPLPVKRHLGFDDERSWIVVAEGNEFLWPGYDLRKIGRTDRYDYGYSAAAVFQSGARRFRRLLRSGQAPAYAARMRRQCGNGA